MKAGKTRVVEGARAAGGSRLGSLLLKRSVIGPEEIRRATADQQAHGGPFVASLVRLGFVKDQDLVQHLHAEYRVPIADLAGLDPSRDVLRLVAPAFARAHGVLPVARKGSTLTLAVADPSDLAAIHEVKFVSGCDLKIVLASLGAIEKAIQKHYGGSARAYEEVLDEVSQGEEPQATPDVDLNDVVAGADAAPVVKLVTTLLADAVDKRASDIHIEPYERGLRVRFRIDGVLHEIMEPPAKLKSALASRIKVMASLDIAERRLPQDGAIHLRLSDRREMSVRVSVLPTLFGEKIVLRLLGKGALQPDISRLGVQPDALAHFRRALRRPSGMVLVTGPTGSGKTTTLYSALALLNESSRNLCSAEDPVEISFPGINQVRIHEAIGLTFASALRALLRQDPDVLMVGEIRDAETVEIAVKASLTGHLVLSTLHTNDAASTITRLLDMGVEPFLVASSVTLILAQRLARVICRHCKVRAEPPPAGGLREVGFRDDEIPSLVLHRGAGCDECANTGYYGRTAFYEVLPVEETIREMILARASAEDIRRAAIARGMSTLRAEGLSKARQGLTTVEEIVRVTVE